MRWLPGLLVLLAACAPESRQGPAVFHGISAARPTGSAGIDPSGLVAAWDMSTVGTGGRLVDFGPHPLHGRIEDPGHAESSPFGGARGSGLGPETASIWVGGTPTRSDMHMRNDEARERSTWSPGDLYPSDACYIGFESHQGNEAHQTMPFRGTIDKRLIFDRAWTDDEVAAFSARAALPESTQDDNGS